VAVEPREETAHEVDPALIRGVLDGGTGSDLEVDVFVQESKLWHAVLRRSTGPADERGPTIVDDGGTVKRDRDERRVTGARGVDSGASAR
jgi:hypothetical protein